MESPCEEKSHQVITIEPNETVLTAFPYRPHNSLLDILRGEPKVLGAIQILLSLITVGLGTILAFNYLFYSKHFPLVILTGFPFWGAFIFLLTGFVTIFNDKSKQILGQGVVSMNSISMLAALAGIALILISFTQQHKLCQAPSLEGTCVVGRTLLLGILSVLLIITIAEFSISVTIVFFRSDCWTTSNKAVFFFPSNVPQYAEQKSPEENATLQFELQRKPSRENTTSEMQTVFLGGYAFFKLSVSRSPLAPPNITETSNKGTSSTHIPDEKESPPLPVKPPEEETRLYTLPPILEPKSSENNLSQQDSRTDQLKDEDLESVIQQISEMQASLLEDENPPIQVLKTSSSHNLLALLPDESSQSLMDALSTQALQSKPSSSHISQSFDLTLEDLPSQEIPSKESTSQEAPFQDTQFLDILTQDTPSQDILYQAPQDTPSQDTVTQDTLSQDIPYQDIPYQDTVTQDTPSQDIPSQDIPYQDTVTQDTLSQDIPYQDIPYQDTPTQDTPSQDIPYQDTPTQDTPSQDIPYQDIPYQDTPTQDTPSQDIPYQDIPYQDTPTQDTPSQDIPYQDTPTLDTPSQDIPYQDTPYQDMPTQDTPSQDIPYQDTLYQDTPTQDTPYQDTPTQDTPSQDTPSQDTQYQYVLSEDKTSQDTPTQDTSYQDTPTQDTQSQDTLTQDTPSQDTPSQDTQYQYVLSEDKTSQTTPTQDTTSQDMSSQEPQNIQLQSEHSSEIIYQDIRTEVMELTKEWKTNEKKSSRRLSLDLQAKHPPKRHSLDLQSKGEPFPRRLSLDLPRKNSRRKSIDQQIKAWLSSKKHTPERQDAYTQTSEQSPDEQGKYQKAKEEEAPIQQPPEMQSKDQKAIEEQTPEEEPKDQEDEDQEADKEQPPEEQTQDQQVEKQQAQEEKSPEIQSPLWQGERQQGPAKRTLMKLCQEWDSESQGYQDFQFSKKSCSYSTTSNWQFASKGSQDWRSQGWRDKDWKAQEWQFEVQPSLDWESQDLLERESLRQKALYQETRSTSSQQNEGHQLQQFLFNIGLCRGSEQQNSESSVGRGETYVDSVQTGDREQVNTEDTFQKPKDQQSEDVKPDDHPSSCQSLVPYIYFNCLSYIDSEQEVQNNSGCSNSSKDLNVTSSSCYQKDQQQAEDSD